MSAIDIIRFEENLLATLKILQPLGDCFRQIPSMEMPSPRICIFIGPIFKFYLVGFTHKFRRGPGHNNIGFYVL